MLEMSGLFIVGVLQVLDARLRQGEVALDASTSCEARMVATNRKQLAETVGASSEHQSHL